MSKLRTPPHSIEAERAILGASLLNRDALETVIGLVGAKDFYTTAHGYLFAAMVELNATDKPIDVLTLRETLIRQNRFETIGGASYIASLTSEVPSVEHATHYAEIVKSLARRRRIISEAQQLAAGAEDENKDIETLLARFDVGTETKEATNLEHISTVMYRVFENLERGYKGEKLPSVATGIEALDENAPLANGDLFILAGRPGMGKTALALKMAYGAAQAGHKVLFVSLEMPAEQITQRVLSMTARNPLTRYRQPKMLTESDWPKMSHAATKLQTLPISISSKPSQTVHQIKAEAARLKRKRGLDLIVIDHLGKIHPDNPHASEYSRISDVVRATKDMTRTLDIPTILCCQLSRKVEQRIPPIPSTSDLRDSGAIEEEADSIAFVYRQDYYTEQGIVKQGGKDNAFSHDLVGRALIRIAKNRHGPTMKFLLNWVGQYSTFEEC